MNKLKKGCLESLTGDTETQKVRKQLKYYYIKVNDNYNGNSHVQHFSQSGEMFRKAELKSNS